MLFDQLIKSPLPDQIITKLRDLIMAGELKPGARLPSESKLSEQFGVGRTTVREALKALVLMGLLDRTTAGTVVSSRAQEKVLDTYASYVYSRESTIVDIYEGRRILEVELAALAAERATEDDIERLQEIVEARQQLGMQDPARHLVSDLEFHLAVAESARNTVLYELYVVICEIMKKLFSDSAVHYTLSPDVFEQGIRNHQALLGAIRDRDVERARALTHDTLSKAEATFLQLEIAEEPAASGV